MCDDRAGTDHDADPLVVARRIALAKLATRAHSVDELRVALAKKNVPTEVIDQLLGRFAEVGLVNDADFAEQWVSARHQNRHASRTVLRRELRAKGVGDDDIEAALRPIDADAELAAAERIAEKKLRSLRGLPAQVATRRLAGALARRGFPPGVVADVARRAIDADGDEWMRVDEFQPE